MSPKYRSARAFTLLETGVVIVLLGLIIPFGALTFNAISSKAAAAAAESKARIEVGNALALEEFERIQEQEALTGGASSAKGTSSELTPRETLEQELLEEEQDLAQEESINRAIEAAIAADKASREASEPLDLSPLWITLGVLGGAGVIGVSGLGVKRQVDKTRVLKITAKNVEALHLERWEAIHKRHKMLEQEYGTYLLDLQEIFKRPALSDVSVPETSAFIESYALLGSSDIAASTIPEQISEYEQKVSAAWAAWRRASAHATKLGLGAFTKEERKKVQRASQLLKMALDPGASEFERAQAYHQVKKLMDGLISLPEPALLKIEAQTRPALTALKVESLPQASWALEAPSRA